MSRKKISVTIYVTPEQQASIDLLHERTRKPRAVFYREGIDLVLQQYASTLNDQATMDFGANDSK